jgi:vitamin B12/bleomycin/antimicrobial peptide transport system ATP-binding/permease protein
MDVASFLTQSLTITIGLLRTLTTLASFVFILWQLSSTPLPVHGRNYAFQGYLVIAAFFYALVGRQLIRLNFMQEKYEADFRFDLVRVREHSEQIALLKGEPVEQQRLMRRYGAVYANSFAVLWRTLKTTSVTSGWNQVALILPSLLIAPAYFAGIIQMGLLFQISGAFVAVQAAFSFFITTYAQLAAWKVTIDRLRGFDEAMSRTETAARTPPLVGVVRGTLEPGGDRRRARGSGPRRIRRGARCRRSVGPAPLARRAAGRSIGPAGCNRSLSMPSGATDLKPASASPGPPRPAIPV